MPYVYLLSWHDEHGAEAVHATLDRAALPDLLISAYPYQDSWSASWADRDRARADRERYEAMIKRSFESLTELLKQPDEKLAADGERFAREEHYGAMPHHLYPEGWGGPHLHVVELE